MATEKEGMPDHHFLPSIPATVFIGTLAFIVFALQVPLLNSDGDLARHLRHGEYMLRHHALITADPFSYTKAGQPFVAFEYGSQLIFALVHRLGGLAAITILAGLLIAATYALLARYMLRRGVEPLLAGLMVGAAMVSGIGHWLARPHLITMVAVLILLEMLTPLGRRRVWPFIPLFAIWANLHGGFSYGLIVIGLFLAGAAADVVLRRDAARRQDARFFATVLVVSLFSTLIHPRAVAVYRHIVSMFGDSYIINHTNEFLSPDFHDPGSKVFLLVMLGVIAACFVSRRRPSFTTTAFILAGIYFALVHQRNVTLFGLTALPLLAVDLDPEWRLLALLRRARVAFEEASRGAATLAWIGPACLAAAVLAANHGRIAGHQLVGDSFSPREFPVAAMNEARAARLPGHLFTDFAWGGYLLYAWPEKQVFIDGGTDFYGGRLMHDYAIIREIVPGWRRLVERWDLSVLMVGPRAPIASEVTHDGGWRYWYCDSTAVIVVRNDAVPMSVAPTATFDPNACAPRPAKPATDR